MSLQNDTKNMSDEIFRQTISQMFTKFDEPYLSKERRCEIIIEIYTFLNIMQLWTYTPKYKKIAKTIIYKGRELLKDINISDIKPETRQKANNIIHTVLRLVCCNKMVKGIYCKRKKIGQYCTFHTNKKNQISKSTTEAIESYVIKDIINIICDYISL